jgi:Family of unknown function (DUF5675)
MPDNRLPMGSALTIQRSRFSDAGTTGKAWLDDGSAPFDSLEGPQRRNAIGSCIPAGVYRAYVRRRSGPPDTDKWAGSHHVYELKDVPGRSHVEIDTGHWAGDIGVGLFSDMAGLIALGSGFATMQPPDPKYAPQLALLHSVGALVVFMQRTCGYGITVRIIDP